MSWLRSRWTVVALVPAFFLAGFGIVSALAGGSDDPAPGAAPARPARRRPEPAGGNGLSRKPLRPTRRTGAVARLPRLRQPRQPPAPAAPRPRAAGTGGGMDGRRRAARPAAGTIAVDYGRWDGVFELANPTIVPDFGVASVVGEFDYRGGVDCPVGLVRVRTWFYNEGGQVVGRHCLGRARSRPGTAPRSPVASRSRSRPTDRSRKARARRACASRGGVPLAGRPGPPSARAGGGHPGSSSRSSRSSANRAWSSPRAPRFVRPPTLNTLAPMALTTSVSLTGDDLTLADVWAVAVDGARAELAERGAAKLRAAREVVERAARAGAARAHVRDQHRLRPLRREDDPAGALRRSCSFASSAATRAASATPTRDEVVRAAMLLRANTLAKGYSGARVRDRRAAPRVPQPRRHPGRAEPRLGRRLRRPRARSRTSPFRSSARARRRSTASCCPAPRRSRASGSSRSGSRRRKASRSSTGRSS